MHPKRTKLKLRSETLRHLTTAELAEPRGGHPTGFGTVPCVVALRAGDPRSEEAGAGPCPGEYSSACVP